MEKLVRATVAVFALIGVLASARTLAGRQANPFAGAPTTHVGVIVRDVDATAQRIRETLGADVPPAFTSGKTVWTGDPSGPTSWRVKLTSFTLGELTVELVEPLDAAGPHRAHLERFGQGLHHIAFVTTDRPAAFAWLTSRGGTQVSPTYVDMKDLLGFTVEIAPDPPRR